MKTTFLKFEEAGVNYLSVDRFGRQKGHFPITWQIDRDLFDFRQNTQLICCMYENHIISQIWRAGI